jgi:hypothetical protein
MKTLFFFILTVLAGSLPAAAQFSRTDSRIERELSALQRTVAPLYRKPSREEMRAVEPSAELAARYGELLRRPNTGLTKLINDRGCAENTIVVVANDECLKYTMPGGGSSYSFRVENYRIPRLADLTYTDQSFQAGGHIVHGIFVNIGDVPLEEVTLATRGLRYLTDFQPVTDYQQARDVDRRLSQGVKSDGFLYRRGLYAVENTTFVLRSIAYGGKYFRAAAGVTYNEFEFDKRRDVIVAFRIVDKDADGNVTILWKQLQEKDAPDVKRRETKKPPAGDANL